MAFVNNYKPSQPASSAPPGPYDINFNLPLPPTLETDRIKLIPLIPSIHVEPYFAASQVDPTFARYLPISFPNLASFHFFAEFIRTDPTSVLFIIIDKTKSNYDENLRESIAGIIGLLHASPQNLSVDIGPVIILPGFQRTFVSSNAIGALLRYCLNLPSDGGIGFRRVSWTANPDNTASIRAAERMGLKQEGTLRWTWVLPLDKEGKQANGRGEGPGRDSVLLSVCWDDWEGGVREHVDKLINRP